MSGKIPLKLDTHNLPIINLVPCSCDVLQSGGKYLFAFEKTEHPVTQSLRKIALENRAPVMQTLFALRNIRFLCSRCMYSDVPKLLKPVNY